MASEGLCFLININLCYQIKVNISFSMFSFTFRGLLVIYFFVSILDGINILQLMAYVGEGNGNLLQYSCLENPWREKSGGL